MALCGLVLALALPAAAADRGKLKAFLDITGFDVALESMGLSAADAPAMLGMDAGDFGGQWRDVVDEVFAAERVKGLALDVLENTLSDELLGHAAGFYASDLGQRLVEVENVAHMRDDTAVIEADGAVAWEVASRERQAILNRLMQAVGGTESSIRAIREVQVRFLMAASAAGVVEYDLDEATLRAILAEGDAELDADLVQMGQHTAALTYAVISDADLETYAGALEAAEMQQVYELMNAIQFEIMANRFEALALRMAMIEPGQPL
ncbi:DUF2059 domain-containing protein [Roseovarius sp. LXJ103]|nr:DUF2059 domain-containing protein [Roseovarius carneus]PWE35190.1 hypothetical protein DD563_03940 [Pelagicola sp. LXJ1103]